MSDDKATCQRCGSMRIAGAGAKCSDLFHVTIGDRERDGYVPYDLGVGGGDYLDFDWCLDCGQMQGEWPLPPSKIESPTPDR